MPPRQLPPNVFILGLAHLFDDASERNLLCRRAEEVFTHFYVADDAQDDIRHFCAGILDAPGDSHMVDAILLDTMNFSILHIAAALPARRPFDVAF